MTLYEFFSRDDVIDAVHAIILNANLTGSNKNAGYRKRIGHSRV